MLRGTRHGWFIRDNPCHLRTCCGDCVWWFSLILGGPHLFPLCDSSECSALTTVPTIIQASKKRKKTAKAPVEQSNVAKEKANIRKRLHLSKEDMVDRSEAVKKDYYRWMAHEDCAMPQFVTFKKEIFWDVDEFTFPINPTDIIELLLGEKLGGNILALFSRSLYLFMEEVITADTHMDTDIYVGIYLTQALKGYDFFVAPYLHKGHVLLIICANNGRGFILDSFKWEKKKTKEDYYLVKQVEWVVGRLSWELPIVNL